MQQRAPPRRPLQSYLYSILSQQLGLPWHVETPSRHVPDRAAHPGRERLNRQGSMAMGCRHQRLRVLRALLLLAESARLSQLLLLMWHLTAEEEPHLRTEAIILRCIVFPSTSF